MPAGSRLSIFQEALFNNSNDPNNELGSYDLSLWKSSSLKFMRQWERSGDSGGAGKLALKTGLWIQRRIYNPLEHLRWSFFMKIVYNFQPLTIFSKNSMVDV